jgi:tRNA(Ile)-lysidine synthase
MPTSLNTKAIFQTLDDLKSRFGDRFVIGLSGGGDSLALAHLCGDWNKRGKCQFLALCFDHGFRAASAVEAQQAASWAQSFGLQATVVTNHLPAPKTGLQEFARNLRLKAFSQAAYDMGGATILLGHTRDDQAETIAFRLARQTGLDGLAGMAPVVNCLAVWQGQSFPIARPLLDVSRGDLRGYLSQAGQTWIEDPSNQNTDFARVKVRQRLAVLGQIERLSHIGRLARMLRDTSEAQTDALEQRASNGDHFTASAFLAAGQGVRARLLRRKLVAVGAPKRPIAPDKIDTLLRHMALDDFCGATLAGVKITRNRHQFHFTKAPARTKSKPKLKNQ